MVARLRQRARTAKSSRGRIQCDLVDVAPCSSSDSCLAGARTRAIEAEDEIIFVGAEQQRCFLGTGAAFQCFALRAGLWTVARFGLVLIVSTPHHVRFSPL